MLGAVSSDAVGIAAPPGAPGGGGGAIPAVASLDTNWVRIINDMTPMIGAMSDGVPDYHAISSLPPFPLFPWFFVLPGLLLAGLAVLIPSDPRSTPRPLTQGVT